MKTLTENEINQVLSSLADEFEKNIQIQKGEGGWGQFIDFPKGHFQIGAYGTAAGLIVLSIAEKQSNVGSEVKNFLKKTWEDWKIEEEKKGRVYVQNLRLAFFYLSLRLANFDELEDVKREVKEEILRRQLPDKLWGNWYCNGGTKDNISRPIVSAVIVLAFSLLEENLDAIPNQINECAKALQKKVDADYKLSKNEILVSMAAILNILKKNELSDDVKGYLKWLIIEFGKLKLDPILYFFEFEYEKDGSKKYSRDYFLIPMESILMFIGFRQSESPFLSLYCNSLLLKMIHRLKNENYFKAKHSYLGSTKDQAWIGLGFAHAKQLDWVWSGSKKCLANILFYFGKEKPNTWFWKFWFPAIILACVGIGIFEPGLYLNIFSDLLSIINTSWEIKEESGLYKFSSSLIRIISWIITLIAGTKLASIIYSKVFIGRNSDAL